MKSNLTTALKNRSAVIAVVGLGYVGLPLALRYLEAGYTVLGLDIDSAKIASILREEGGVRSEEGGVRSEEWGVRSEE